ncbi:MAG TPA: S1/P1 nuclease [Flavisolibacter sp.]|nr:S1/P1 nuclease [Flavisolibacter sp.]
MQKTVLQKLLLIGLFFYLPLSSMAWGMLGHRIVGEIADKYLNAKTRIEIQKILGTESVAMASNWADFIKSDSTYKYLDKWHYVNFKKGLSYEELKAFLKTDTAVNAHTRINFLVKELKKKNLPADKKLMYLRLLIHIVGDIHQPLHVSPEGSTGGNDIRVNWFSTPSNLHRVWDSQLIDYQQLSYTEYVKHINHTTPAQRKTWQSQPLSQWLFESYSIAQDLHNEIKEENPRLGYRYDFDHHETLNEQLLKGGVRLAGLLNQIFG